MLRDLAVRGGLTGCVIVGLAGDAAGQGSVSGGAREILSIGFASGVMPREIRSPSSGLVVVDKDGVRMLRASTASEFRVQLPEQLPANFTLEFDLIAKECFCDPADLRFEGRAGSSQSDVYAEVQWSPTHQSVVGGATHNPGPFTATTPPSLSETLRGQSARIVVGFEGNVIRLYTNGTRLYTVSDRQFARTNVLRVSLGGQDEGGDAVFLARIRVAEGTVTTGPAIAQDPGGRFSPTGRETSTASSPPPSPPPPAPTRPPPGTALPPVPPPPPPAPPEPAPAPAAPAPPPAPAPAPVPSPAGVAGVVAQVDAQGTVSVSWQAVTGATSYFVVRWLVGDNVCCGNTSPPEGIASLTWRDGVLPKAGTYGYRVYATLPSVISTGETTVGYQPPAAAAPASPRAPVPQTIKLTGVAGTGGAGTGLPPRRIALQGFTSSGAYVHVVVASRTIATPVITATGSLRSVAKSGSVTAAAPVPQTIAVGAVTASGEYGARIVANQTIPLAAITATAGGVVVVPPRTIELVGVTAVGSTKTSTKIQ